MAIHEVFMPALSSTMTEGKIVSWQKSPGDKIEKGETVLIVESDKADMDVESFYEGYLATIITPAGEAAPVGNTIALIAETQGEIEQAKQKATSVATATPTAVAQPVAASPVAATTVLAASPKTSGNGRIIASPRARKLAKELNLDLAILTGTGPHGRIVAEDVETASGRPVTTQTQPVSKAVTTVPAPTPVAAPLGQVAPMNTLQNAVVRNMMASLSVPVFRVGYTITTDALDQLYKQLKSKGVTMTALLAKAVAVTLQKHPILNASYVENGIQNRAGINIAIAVAMPGGGLITPVLQNADQIDIYSLSRTWKDLVERSRVKQLKPDEYSSGTFSLSNLGMFGVDKFDAILPPGQGSILAIGASQAQLVVSADGSMAVKRQMQVNITCDHRIIYGADAATFLQNLAKLIETNVQSLTM
ncbi:MAG TPA: branched-chain alpha-keto acid dehydrogenase subunit E2 [Planktothrix sp. UBA8402]|nr:branched-chain alpha-keto acid dehydrogenase subunit E2 [Planktothrix sp. UBA8402]